MNRGIWIALGALLLVACSRQPRFNAVVAESAPGMAAPVRMVVPPRQPGDTLAYEHSVSVELSKELLPQRMQDVQTACTSNKEYSCTVLDMNLQRSETVPSGSIRMRMAPAAVTPIIEIASKGGEVASRASHAEDLAEPVADTARELSMLVAQREKLEGFLKSKDLKIDQLITLSKELASVQAQIDSVNTRGANLRRRIDTELLNIDFRLPPQAFGAEQTPVRDALRLFGSNFLEAIGMVISFVAMLLPWLILVVPGIVLLRIFWRAITRWLVRRETRSS
jgi:hypothetical protein